LAFEDLINRGLKRVLGIIETVKAVYPYADHQLCFVHLQRNIRKYMTKADAAEFNKELDKIKFASSFDEAVHLCSKFKSKYSRYMNILMEKAEHYMAFIKYHQQCREYQQSS